MMLATMTIGREEEEEVVVGEREVEGEGGEEEEGVEEGGGWRPRTTVRTASKRDENLERSSAASIISGLVPST